jgi:hypothetical protein
MKLRLWIPFATIIVLSACGGGGGKKQDSQPLFSDPCEAVLLVPLQNQVCTVGTVVNASQSTITFSWNKSDNTDKYCLTLTNLLTGEQAVTETKSTSIGKTIARNTPFSWYITSLSDKNGATGRNGKSGPIIN